MRISDVSSSFSSSNPGLGSTAVLASSSDSEKQICSICQCTLADHEEGVQFTGCHVYGKKCFRELVRNGGRDCAVCKTPLSPELISEYSDPVNEGTSASFATSSPSVPSGLSTPWEIINIAHRIDSDYSGVSRTVSSLSSHPAALLSFLEVPSVRSSSFPVPDLFARIERRYSALSDHSTSSPVSSSFSSTARPSTARPSTSWVRMGEAPANFAYLCTACHGIVSDRDVHYLSCEASREASSSFSIIRPLYRCNGCNDMFSSDHADNHRCSSARQLNFL
jgi:hypothetical protein